MYPDLYRILGVILISNVLAIKSDPELRSSTSTIYFASGVQNVGEWEDYVEVLIFRYGDEDRPCSFVLYTEQGSATSPLDYTESSQELLFLAGETDKLTWIHLIDDDEMELPETFFIRMEASDADPDVDIIPPAQVRVEIWDDDMYDSSYDSVSFYPPLCEEEMCENGGTCYGYSDDDDYSCECTKYWTGPTCEDPSPCFNDGVPVCHNNAQCYVMSPTEVWCDCGKWYRGYYCENAPLLEPIYVYIISAALTLIIIIVCILACCCCFYRRQQSPNRGSSRYEDGVEMHGKRSWKDSELKPGLHKTNSYLSAPLPGTEARFGGRYEFPRDRLILHEEIGQGAFAIVYRAEAVGILNKPTSTKVAVKMLKTGASENDRRDFIKELDLYKTLELHPNIITLLGCCTEGVPMYLILEFAHNGSLHSHLSRIRSGDEDYLVPGEKSLSSDEILSYASQIANGMEYLSSKNCVHRDLATRNVLLGDGMVCKLSDFGLARDMDTEQQYEMKSKGRVPVRWMAIESILQNLYTSKSDVWSFGVVIWELVTLGSHPYPGFSSREVIVQVQKGYRLPKPMHCSDDLYEMMQGCWRADPNDRPTFTSLRTKLENILGDAKGYLMMTDFKEEAYVYLEPNPSSRIQETLTENDGLDNSGYTSEAEYASKAESDTKRINSTDRQEQSVKGKNDKNSETGNEKKASHLTSASLKNENASNEETSNDALNSDSESNTEVLSDSHNQNADVMDGQRVSKKPPQLPRQPSAWF